MTILRCVLVAREWTMRLRATRAQQIMPVVPFENLPDASRIWVFGSDKPLTEEGTTALLKGVDAYLADWKAHGAPLTVASQFRDKRFLVVGVDQSMAGATGCSIDGLFRVLQGLEKQIGTSMVGGGRVFYRAEAGTVQSASRDEIPGLMSSGAITKDTVVFDQSITDLGTFRAAFERRAKESWVRDLAGFAKAD